MKVLIVEDDEFWLHTLSNELELESDIDVIGMVPNQQDAIKLLEQSSVDVILMDIHLGEDCLDGLELTKKIVSDQNSEIKVIMLTANAEHEIIIQSFQKGAVNFISKSNYTDIVNAIREADNGNSSIHPDASNALRNEIVLSVLTPTEREVLALKEQGLKKSEIAQEMNKSFNTIKWHMKSIKNKLFGS